MATSRKAGQKGTGGAKAESKGKKLMSPKTQAFFALNDILTLHAEDENPAPEVLAGRKVLADNGFDIRPSRAQEIEKIKAEMAAVDATDSNAAATLIDLGKRLSAAQRGKVQAAKTAKA